MSVEDELLVKLDSIDRGLRLIWVSAWMLSVPCIAITVASAAIVAGRLVEVIDLLKGM